MAIRLDEQSVEDLDRRYAESMKHIEAFANLWPGLVRLPEKLRRNHPGLTSQIMAAPFRLLFRLLAAPSGAPAKGEPKLDAEAQQQREVLARLQGVFHAALGSQDEGLDPGQFEAGLLLRRQHRVELESKLAEALGDLARHFADDALHTGAAVAAPGQLALDLTRSLATGNAEFRTLLAPVLDALRAMTRAARAALAAAKKAQEDEPPAK